MGFGTVNGSPKDQTTRGLFPEELERGEKTAGLRSDGEAHGGAIVAEKYSVRTRRAFPAECPLLTQLSCVLLGSHLP